MSRWNGNESVAEGAGPREEKAGLKEWASQWELSEVWWRSQGSRDWRGAEGGTKYKVKGGGGVEPVLQVKPGAA